MAEAGVFEATSLGFLDGVRYGAGDGDVVRGTGRQRQGIREREDIFCRFAMNVDDGVGGVSKKVSGK